MKEIKNGEVVEETLDEVIDMDEIEEKLEPSKSDALKSKLLKVKSGLKKHKKKIAACAIFGLGILAGVAIGSRGDKDDEDDSYSEDDIIDAVTFTEVDVDDSTDYEDEESEETENEE